MTRAYADLRDICSELVEYRELLFRITARDLMVRYKQSAMGFGWAVFVPLINTIVFSVIFTRVAPIETGVPYPVFAYCGLLAWNFSASSLRFAVTSLTSNPNLVTKVFFPREILPLSAVLVGLVDFLVGSTVLVALMIFYRVPISGAVAWLPLVILVHAAFTAGVGLFLAMGNLFYRDVKYLFEAVITIWMFATSVLYPVQVVTGPLGSLLQANPMTPIIDAYRAVLLRGEAPSPAPFLAAAVVAAGTLVVAWVAFHRAETQFAESV